MKRGLAPNCMAIPEATITRRPGNKKAGFSQLWSGLTARADYSKLATIVHSPTPSGITPASVRDRLVDELLHLLAEVGALRARRLRHQHRGDLLLRVDPEVNFEEPLGQRCAATSKRGQLQAFTFSAAMRSLRSTSSRGDSYIHPGRGGQS